MFPGTADRLARCFITKPIFPGAADGSIQSEAEAIHLWREDSPGRAGRGRPNICAYVKDTRHPYPAKAKICATSDRMIEEGDQKHVLCGTR